MIKSAQIHDLDRIEDIEKASFASPWSRAAIEAEFNKDYSHFFICEEREEIIGYIIVWNLGCEWEVITLAVAERFRRRGVADSLLEYALNCSEVGAEWHLEVACDNDAAISLYKKHGFKHVGIINNYYGQGRNAFRMLRKSLS